MNGRQDLSAKKLILNVEKYVKEGSSAGKVRFVQRGTSSVVWFHVCGRDRSKI